MTALESRPQTCPKAPPSTDSPQIPVLKRQVGGLEEVICKCKSKWGHGCIVNTQRSDFTLPQSRIYELGCELQSTTIQTVYSALPLTSCARHVNSRFLTPALKKQLDNSPARERRVKASEAGLGNPLFGHRLLLSYQTCRPFKRETPQRKEKRLGRTEDSLHGNTGDLVWVGVAVPHVSARIWDRVEVEGKLTKQASCPRSNRSA